MDGYISIGQDLNRFQKAPSGRYRLRLVYDLVFFINLKNSTKICLSRPLWPSLCANPPNAPFAGRHLREILFSSAKGLFCNKFHDTDLVP